MATTRKKTATKAELISKGYVESSPQGLTSDTRFSASQGTLYMSSTGTRTGDLHVAGNLKVDGKIESSTTLHEQATQASQAILELDQKIAELEVESDVLYTKISNMQDEAEIQGKIQARTEYPELDGFKEREPYEQRKKNIWLNAKQEYQDTRKKRKEIELELSKLRAQKDHFHRMFKLQLSCIGSPNLNDLPEQTEGRLRSLFDAGL